MQIAILPALADNYIYALIHASAATIIDPGDAQPVQAFLAGRNLRLHTILLTHAHGDHTAGAAPLRAATGCAVMGPAGIPNLDRELRAGDHVTVPGTELNVLSTPGHLPVHLSFHDAKHQALFCGDTLFGAGCGRILGSTAAVLWESLNRLRALPPETRIYCGHEYTADNLEFAATVEPENVAIAARLTEARQRRDCGEPTIPSTLALELETNVFLRAGSLERFAELRRQRDRW